MDRSEKISNHILWILWKLMKSLEGKFIKKDWARLLKHQKMFGYSDEDVMYIWGRICQRKAESIKKLLERFPRTVEMDVEKIKDHLEIS